MGTWGAGAPPAGACSRARASCIAASRRGRRTEWPALPPCWRAGACRSGRPARSRASRPAPGAEPAASPPLRCDRANPSAGPASAPATPAAVPAAPAARPRPLVAGLPARGAFAPSPPRIAPSRSPRWRRAWTRAGARPSVAPRPTVRPGRQGTGPPLPGPRSGGANAQETNRAGTSQRDPSRLGRR